MKNRYIVCFLGSILLLGGCGKSKKRAAQIVPPLQIQVVEASRRQIPRRMQFTGQTYSLSDASVQPRVSGYLVEVNYRDGMPVKKGQLLVRLDSRPMQAEVSGAEAALASARAQLVEAQNTYDRSVPLARINAISQSALDEATANLNSAQANVKSAEATLRNAGLDLSYSSVYSPMDGIIGTTIPAMGDYVGVGTQFAVINTISNIDSIYVNIYLPSAIYLEITGRERQARPGYMNQDLLSDIAMILPDGSTYTYPGVYKYTERMINSEAGSLVLRILFPNPDHALMPGQYARVEANVGREQDVVLIPQRAVRQTQNITSVYVVDSDSTVHYRQVTLGDTYGWQWIVESGLEPGERVLTEGLQKVKEGARIVPVVVTAAQLEAQADSTSNTPTGAPAGQTQR